ncbi:proto-oncogene Mas-like [Ahaetulla prasina]|uniref:proto-oncogene Mas-like n=1 Tax=Ahaetulla prasina TaxID=499056 RepID=UPI00264901C5|nr:proto-oncogene Mas-like [Ahaetulla prasina]
MNDHEEGTLLQEHKQQIRSLKQFTDSPGPLFDNWTAYFRATSVPHDLTRNLINGFIVIICILGLLGNGRTFNLLAYSIRRNSCTTFILNLSVADCGVLASFIIVAIFVAALTQHKESDFLTFFLFLELFFFTYSASQFLLTAIILDRCVAVHFPLWHRCHRPPYLSTLVCGLIWILSFLLSVMHFILHQTWSSQSSRLLYQLIVNGLLCTPLMVVSLWIHVSCKVQRNQKKLFTAILLALLCVLLFSLPMNVLYVVECFDSRHPLLLTIGMGCAALNSSIKPLLYFFVGRRKNGKHQPRASYKVALQRVFKDQKVSPKPQLTIKEDQL